jgi:soluble lytic murein transglycosylase-like protein
MTSPYREAIVVAANNYGLDPLLVEAVVQQESSGRADAFRHEPAFWARYCAMKAQYRTEDPRRIASSYGLMQVMYPTAYGVGFRGQPEELFGIETNLDIGCRVLKSLLVRTSGDLRAALASYNGGPAGATATIPLRYADEVLARYRQLQAGTVA